MKYLGMILLLFFAACDSDDQENDVPDVNGANYALSNNSFTDTYSSVKGSLQAAGPVTIVAEVNHRSNAQGVGEDLKETRTIFFGNPALGTAFMQENQQAGLDLPQKIAVYTNGNDNAVLIYNSVDYLKNRHGVDPDTAPMVAMALENIASNATGRSSTINTSNVSRDQGVITVDSDQSFDDTYASLITTLNSNAAISIVAELDHQQNAASVNLSLRPTRVVIFGNPTLGTPLLQESGNVSLDLPQKMLVYQDAAGNVKIAYNDASFIASRHGISQNDGLTTINNALSNLAEKAAGR